MCGAQMNRNIWFLLVALSAVWGAGGNRNSIAAAGPSTVSSSRQQEGFSASDDTTVFDLGERSVFDLPGNVWRAFVSGAFTVCGIEPEGSVREYPAFRSAKPLYGALFAGANYADREKGIHYFYALDESQGTGQGYDRLYFDSNGNKDLTDDTPVGIMKDAPARAYLYPRYAKVETCFDFVQVEVDPNDRPGRKLEIMPRFLRFREDSSSLWFVTTEVHVGRIRLGDRQFEVFLGHDGHVIAGFDHPWTGLYFVSVDAHDGRTPWVGSGRLRAMHKRGNTFYRFAATAAGDKLFVRPYRGPVGMLEVRAGGRPVDNMSIKGSLEAKDFVIGLGEELGEPLVESARAHVLPVGDYQVDSVTVTCGRLQFGLSQNRYGDGQPRRPDDQRRVPPIAIRADKPFTLDFAGKPEVLFASPARNHRIKRGQELKVTAVLIDPRLDLMIHGIQYQKRTVESPPGGPKAARAQNVSADPKVTIARANGEVVAEGVMPFG